MGTFFEKQHLSYKEVFYLSWLWCTQAKQKDIIQWVFTESTDLSKHSVIDWLNFFRDICVDHFTLNPTIIGGPGMEVEIDGTVITKRKYHRGRAAVGGNDPDAQRWFFGGIERGSGRFFVAPVRNENIQDIDPLILRHILPGTRIISDGALAYSGLANRHPQYTHSVVIHDQNFINPNDPTAHTQNIESLWQKLKAPHKQRYGTQRTLLEAYVAEYCWRKEFKSDLLYSLWNQIALKYPVTH